MTINITYHISYLCISVTFVNLLLPFFKDFSQTWESEGFSTGENPWHCFPLVPLEAFGHEILIARDMPKGIELLRQMGQGSILETGEVWNDNGKSDNRQPSQEWMMRFHLSSSKVSSHSFFSSLANPWTDEARSQTENSARDRSIVWTCDIWVLTCHKD